MSNKTERRAPTSYQSFVMHVIGLATMAVLFTGLLISGLVEAFTRWAFPAGGC